MDLSILIPTMNRPDKLRRALTFLEKENFEGVVLIGDSSSPDNTEADFFDNCFNLNIEYRYYPQQEYPNDGHVMKAMLEEVETKYAVYQGDDDFLLPNALKECVAFLESNEGYSACHGLRASVFYKKGRIVSGYVQPGLEAEGDVLERWIQYIQSGLSSQAYVHSTATWRKMYRDVDKVPIRYLGPELLPCSMTYILGKVKLLDCLQYVFEKDAENRQVDWEKKSFFEYIHDPKWYKGVRVLRKSVTQALNLQGIDKVEANEVFKREFWQHVAAILSDQWVKRYSGHKISYPEQFGDTLMCPVWPHYSEFRKIYLCAS